jgi:hypothetical protein
VYTQALKEMKGATGSEPVDNQMGLREFIAGLVRIAHARFKKMPSLADRWEAFMRQHVKKYADIGDLEDEITAMLQWKEVESVLNTHADMLKQAFLNFCVSEAEMAPGMDAQAQMMNMAEWMGFLTEAKLLDKQLTVREARGIFVQVNLDDDLFVQEDSNNSSSVRWMSLPQNPYPRHFAVFDSAWRQPQELVFDEYIECLVRVAWEKEPLQSMTGGDEEDADYREEVAECLSEWFVLAVAPHGQEPKKKKGGKKKSK